MIYKLIIKPVLFLFDPESVHNFVLNFFSKFRFLYPFLKFIYSPKIKNEITLNNLKFKNCIGLAAGFDKNGIALGLWSCLGFSHVEIGTVTPLPQPGNDKPRIFRLKKDYALINRLGFNNHGADVVRKNILEGRKLTGKDFIIGVNIGKNKDTQIIDAVSDYKICFEKLFDAADYFTLNISSPNTEGLRKLHEENYLNELLSELQQLNKNLSDSAGMSLKPVFLKIAPDLNIEMIQTVYKTAVNNNITGIIATNTTVERPGLKSDINENGGLSGMPLKKMSDKVLKKLFELNEKNPDKKLILIGCGGIFSREDLLFKQKYGASLIQIYTGFIYEGPGILKKLLKL